MLAEELLGKLLPDRYAQIPEIVRPKATVLSAAMEL